jgi:DNA repair exonuclease SbcCD ATPase subunit
MVELKVREVMSQLRRLADDDTRQAKLESQYATRRDAHLSEVQDLRQQLELKQNEIRTLIASIESLKSLNDELRVGFAYLQCPTCDDDLVRFPARICNHLSRH